MTSSVTAPLEKQFGQVPGLTQMTSISSFGSSLITLQFSLELNIDIAEQEVQAAINAAGSFLPTNLPMPPVYSKTNPADAPILTIAITSDDDAAASCGRSGRNPHGAAHLAAQGRRSGQHQRRPAPAVRVQANPTALASYGLSLETLRTAIGSANANAAKGNFDGAEQAWTINDNDQIRLGRAVCAHYHRLPQWRAGAPLRRRQNYRRHRKHQASRLGQ